MCCSQADASSDDGDGGGSVDRDGVSGIDAVESGDTGSGGSVDRDGVSGIDAVEVTSLAMVVGPSTESVAVDILQTSRRVQR
jgi:hypothetical protein